MKRRYFFVWMVFLLGCNAKLTILGSGVQGASSALLLSSSGYQLATSSTHLFSASGGTPPYTFSIQSGGGSINATTGLYTAAAGVGSATILVTDTRGQQTTSDIDLIPPMTASQDTFTFSQSAGLSSPLPTWIEGGVPPYSYHLISGPGSIDQSTGMYTHAQSGGLAVIEVRDTYGNTKSLDMNVYPALTNAPISSYDTDGTNLFIGGFFSSIHSRLMKGLLNIDKSDSQKSTESCQDKWSITGTASIILEHSGFLYLAGDFTNINGVTVGRIAKLNLSNCELDSTFSHVGFDNSVSALHIFNNALYVGGNFSTYRGLPAYRIAKISLSDGALDTTFSQATGISDGVSFNSLYAIKDDGADLFIAGDFTRYRGTMAFRLAKINANSSNLVSAFDTTTGANAEIRRLHYAFGSLYVGGHFTTYKGSPALYLMKINPSDASLDTTFTQASGLTNPGVMDIKSDPTSLYVSGAFTTYRGTTTFGLLKLNKDNGNLDTSFSQNPSFNAQVSSIEIEGNFLYANGSFTSYRGIQISSVAKLNLSDGSLDTTFHSTVAPIFGLMGGGPNGALSLGSSNTIWVGGVYSYGGIIAKGLAKLNATTLTVDSSFNQSSGLISDSTMWIRKVHYANSSLYVLGSFTTYRGTNVSNRGIIKLNPTNGNLDVAFNPLCTIAGSILDIDSGGGALYFVRWGGFASCNGTTTGLVVKLDWNTGVYQPAFVSDTSFPFGAFVTSIEVGASQAYIGGQFSQYKGSNVSGLIRVATSNGARDTTFNNGAGDLATAYVRVLRLDEMANSLWIGGSSISSYKGATHNDNLIKIETSLPQVDTAFSQLTAFPNGWDYDYGKIAHDTTSLFVTQEVSGATTTYRGATVGKVVKIDKLDGDLDTSFNPSLPIGVTVGDSVVIGNYYFVGGLRLNKNTGAIE